MRRRGPGAAANAAPKKEEAFTCSGCWALKAVIQLSSPVSIDANCCLVSLRCRMRSTGEGMSRICRNEMIAAGGVAAEAGRRRQGWVRESPQGTQAAPGVA